MLDLAPVPIALVGLPGAGKSTVAMVLAERLDRTACDLDELLAARHGVDAATLLDREGEPRFRQLEAAALAEVLSVPQPIVLACGGGVVTRSENRALLRRAARCVWVRVDPDLLVERVSGSRQRRPLLGDDPRGRLEELEASRSPLYAEIAEVVVDGSGTPEEVADRILEGLAE